MANIFGGTEVLPSWLRDDGSRAVQGFSMGLQAANAIQGNKQRTIENQRAERRLTIEEDQAETRKLLNQSQIEGERLKVDQAKAFAQDTPAIYKFGAEASKLESLEELDALAASVPTTSLAGQTAKDKVWEVHQGRIAEKNLRKFGSRMKVKEEAAKALGLPWGADEYRQAAIETTFELDPKTGIKTILPREIAADAAMYGVDKRAETQLELGAMRGEQLMNASAAKALSQGLGGVRAAVIDNALPGLVAGLKEIGYEPSETEIQSFRSKAIAGGVDPTKAPASVVKNLASESVGFRKLENVNKRISAFDRKYGAGAFEDFIGPFDQPKFKFETASIPQNQLTAAQKEARSIFQSADETVQAYRNGQFGTALTQGETSVFEKIAGTPGWNSYAGDLKNFQENLGRSAAERTRDWIWAVNIPDRIKGAFYGYLTPEDEAAGVTAPAKSSTSVTPIRTPPKVGEVVNGYKFIGGNVSDPSSWQKQ